MQIFAAQCLLDSRNAIKVRWLTSFLIYVPIIYGCDGEKIVKIGQWKLKILQKIKLA